MFYINSFFYTGITLTCQFADQGEQPGPCPQDRGASDTPRALHQHHPRLFRLRRASILRKVLQFKIDSNGLLAQHRSEACSTTACDVCQHSMPTRSSITEPHRTGTGLATREHNDAE